MILRAPDAGGGAAPAAAAVEATAAANPDPPPADAAAKPADGATVLTEAAPAAKAEEKPAAKAEEKPAAKGPEPVTYADFRLPDDLAPDDSVLTTFKDSASKLGVTQDQAQALIDAVAPALRANAEAAAKRWGDLNTEWQATVKKEFAGPAFDAMKTNVGRFFDDFVGAAETAERKALNEALLLTGAGNNPHIVRLIAKAAEAYTEGGPVSGTPAGRAGRDAASVLYDSHNKQAEG